MALIDYARGIGKSASTWEYILLTTIKLDRFFSKKE